MAVRQFEFALLQLMQQIDGLLAAAHRMLQGKLPRTLISPTTLHDILRNVSFHLPDNYELVAVSLLSFSRIFLFWTLIQSARLHSVKGNRCNSALHAALWSAQPM